MDILYLLIPLALIIVAGAVTAFRWATRDGQFDDLETPAIRILMDERQTDGDEPPTGGGTPRDQSTE